MVPLIMMGAMAAMSIAQSNEQNKQASNNAQATAKQLLTQLNVTNSNISNTARELNKQTGIELTQIQLEGLKNQATTSNIIVEKEVSGAVAERLYENSDMKELLMSNQVKQKAEANMVKIQEDYMSAMYQYQQGTLQNEITRRNNTKSRLSIIAGAVSAGAQGYAMGSAFAGAGATTLGTVTGSTSTYGGSNFVSDGSVSGMGGGLNSNPIM
jgi:hypothetical protein